MDKNLTAFLAVWGAVLSTIGIAWNLYRDLSDRGRLRVTCYLGNIITPGGLSDPKDYLVWSVVNVGRRPIVVQHLGGINADKHFLIMPRNTQLPKTLEPGESLSDYSPELSLLGKKLKHLTALDTTGKYHKVPRKQVRALKRQYAEEHAGRN